MVSNRKIGNDAVKIVKRYLKKKGWNPTIENRLIGYDIKAQQRFIEVKGTRQSNKNKQYFDLTKGEYNAARKHKNYWIYWVNTKDKTIIMKISRKDILLNTKRFTGYHLHLRDLKRARLKK